MCYMVRPIGNLVYAVYCAYYYRVIYILFKYDKQV